VSHRKSVIGKRLEQSGMYWSQSGAENILALRCALMGNRWDEYWDQIKPGNRIDTRWHLRDNFTVFLTEGTHRGKVCTKNPMSTL